MTTIEANRAMARGREVMEAANVWTDAAREASAAVRKGSMQDTRAASEHLNQRTQRVWNRNASMPERPYLQGHQSSVDAHQASAQAYHTGERSDHRAAADAHFRAEQDNTAAAKRAGENNHADEKQHFETMAAGHKGDFNHHESLLVKHYQQPK